MGARASTENQTAAAMKAAKLVQIRERIRELRELREAINNMKKDTAEELSFCGKVKEVFILVELLGLLREERELDPSILKDKNRAQDVFNVLMQIAYRWSQISDQLRHVEFPQDAGTVEETAEKAMEACKVEAAYLLRVNPHVGLIIAAQIYHLEERMREAVCK